MKAASELEKRLEEDEATRKRESMLQKGQDVDSMIHFAKYELDPRLKVDREVDPPPKELFIGLGWDEFTGQKRKHYRQFYNDELENDKEIFERASPFNTYNLTKGENGRNSIGLFKNNGVNEAAEQRAPEQLVVGKFKAIVEVANKQDTSDYFTKKQEIINTLKFQLNALSLKKLKKPYLFDTDKLQSAVERRKFEHHGRALGIEHLNLSKHLCNLNSDEILKRSLLAVTKCIVRFYAVSGYDMSSRDNGSASDTYLKLKMNDDLVDERENYQLDEPNPSFYKSYDFEASLPGTSPLSI